MVTPEGVLYEREAILTYMVDQKAKIAATKKRKLKEAEKEDEDETPKKKVFKGQCKYKAVSLLGQCITIISNSVSRYLHAKIWIKSEQFLGTRL